MSTYADIWRLPGPGGFIQEVARLAHGGQHVLAIIPSFIAGNPDYADALTAAIANELDDGRRILPSGDAAGLAGAFGFELVDDFDRFPATVPELVSHPEVAGRTFVCSSGDLAPEHLAQLSNFLKRLDDESRPVPKAERCTMVFILGRSQLPKDADSVVTARLWYWDRVARWDVAALLASQLPSDEESGVLAEVRLETIIEIARWDFTFALKIAREWTGDEAGLISIVNSRTSVDAPAANPKRISRKRPPEHHLNAWDEGRLESWHGESGYSPASLASSSGKLGSLMWSAQARVLLPWIEVRRVRLAEVVRKKLGVARMEAAVSEFTSRSPAAGEDRTIVEVATLSRIISARFGAGEPQLRTTADLLRDARNRLAHLRALPQIDLERLVAECRWLDQ